MENEIIPTAEQFLKENNVVGMTDLVTPIMIEFAKLHVEAALKGASKTATINKNRGQFTGREFGNVTYSINQPSILNAYSLENIK